MPLELVVKEKELFNSQTEEFITIPQHTLYLEHSLYAISKWESKWHKPFFGPIEKTAEEALDYLACMVLNPTFDPDVFLTLSKEDMDRINHYIDDPMTATTFGDEKPKKKGGKLGKKITTSEEIYYMLTALNIPFECDRWHFNKLQTLIRVCSIKNAPPKKMSKRDVLNKYKSLNDARRKALGTSG